MQIAFIQSSSSVGIAPRRLSITGYVGADRRSTDGRATKRVRLDDGPACVTGPIMVSSTSNREEVEPSSPSPSVGRSLPFVFDSFTLVGAVDFDSSEGDRLVISPDSREVRLRLSALRRHPKLPVARPAITPLRRSPRGECRPWVNDLRPAG